METTTSGTTPTPHQNSDKDFEDIRPEVENMSQDESERRARIEYLRSLTGNKKPKKKRHTWLKVLVTIVVIALLAGGVFWYFSKSSDSQKNKDTAQKPAASEPATPQQVATKHYDSSNFNLGFDYPENWKVSDEGKGLLSVVSPAAKFKTASGNTNAQVVFTIQTKQSTLPGFKSGNGLAIRTSEKIAYLKPTPNQRAQTYMTFVSNAGSTSAGIDAVFVTGDLGYQKDQAVPQKDIIQGDPLVSMYFAKCNGTTCASDPTTAKVAIADSAWDDSNALIKAAKALLTSLAIN